MKKNNRLSEKPYLIEADKAHKNRVVSYLKDGTALVVFGKDSFKVPKSHQYDLTQATIFGLNERLTSAATSPKMNEKGETLRDLFNLEWEKYSKAIEVAGRGLFNYGVYAYYPEKNDLVRYASEYWHRTVAVASSSKLLTDPKGKLLWKEIRDIFENATIAVAGGSVGNNIFHALCMDLRPKNIKIADKSLYKMENINRVRLNYRDIVESNDKRKNLTDTLLRNKAVVTAEQIYMIDPYINIYTYPEGITDENVKSFLGGEGKEPEVKVIVEEVDDPRIKIMLREEARKRGIILIMATDVGSSVQLDISRYDKNKKLPLTYGISDKALHKATEAVYEHPGDRAKFFEFVDALIGTDYRKDELQKIILNKSEIPTSTIIPQLGGTAIMASGIMSETIARMLLGHDYPKRVLINKRTFEVVKYN